MPRRPGCLRVEPLPKIIQGQLSQLLKLGLATGAWGAPGPKAAPLWEQMVLVIFISFYQSQLVRNSLSREVLPTPHSFGYGSKPPFPHASVSFPFFFPPWFF